MTKQTIGGIGWRDLTCENAEGLRDFYEDVVGWQSSPVSMGDYNDFNMMDGEGNVVAGVCHGRGSNEGVPAQWMMYVIVAGLEASLRACESRGGACIGEIRSMGADRFAVIRDPAGACMALYEEG